MQVSFSVGVNLVESVWFIVYREKALAVKIKLAKANAKAKAKADKLTINHKLNRLKPMPKLITWRGKAARKRTINY